MNMDTYTKPSDLSPPSSTRGCELARQSHARQQFLQKRLLAISQIPSMMAAALLTFSTSYWLPSQYVCIAVYEMKDTLKILF